MRAVLLAVLFTMWGCQTVPADYGAIRDKAADGSTVSLRQLNQAFFALEDLPERMDRLNELEQQALALIEDEPLKLGSMGTAILDTHFGSLTGHFVLSSLHGPDAVAALHRLLDMGIEAFLVASAIVGVL